MAGGEHGETLSDKVWRLLDKYYIHATVLAAIALWALVASALLIDIQLPQAQEELVGQPGGGGGAPLGAPDVVITIYGGELPGGVFGFGLSPDDIQSPGPEIRVKQGQVVEIRFVNLGSLRHGFAIVPEVKKTNPDILFNALVGPPSNPIPPGGEGSVIFVASQPGTYYYQCPVSNHGPKGMWGVFIVEP